MLIVIGYAKGEQMNKKENKTKELHQKQKKSDKKRHFQFCHTFMACEIEKRIDFSKQPRKGVLERESA